MVKKYVSLLICMLLIVSPFSFGLESGSESAIESSVSGSFGMMSGFKPIYGISGSGSKLYTQSLLSISGVSHSVSGNDVTFIWTTDEASTSEVYVWRTTSTPDSSPYRSSSAYDTNHHLIGTALTSGYSYNYYVKSVTEDGNYTVDNNGGGNYTFTITDSTPPSAITGLKADSVSFRKVVLSWSKSSDSDLHHYVVYRNGQQMGIAQNTTYTDESVSGSNTYFYQVAGSDVNNNVGNLSEKLNVTTPAPDYNAPDVNVTLSSMTNNTASFSVKTSEESYLTFYYGEYMADMNPLNYSELKTDFSVDLAGLVSQKIYYYYAHVCDKDGNCKNTATKSFKAGQDMTPPKVNATVPDYFNSHMVTFGGESKPLSELKLYVNGRVSKVITQVGSDGRFEFENVALSSGSSEFNLTIIATDQFGGTGTWQKTVHVDAIAPVLTVDLPEIVTKSNTKINASVSEEATIEVYVFREGDDSSPAAVTGLNGTTTSGGVKLDWTKSNETDILKYVIYRYDLNGAIGTSLSNTFTDTSVRQNAMYQYQVAAMDTSCNVGDKSSSVSVVSVSAGSTNATKVDVNCSSDSAIKSFTANGAFNLDLNLYDGGNYVKIVAKDKANNTDIYIGSVYYDSSPPKILSTNLGNESPYYSNGVWDVMFTPTLTVRGQISEAAKVDVYINNETVPSSSVMSDDNGTFEVDVELRRDSSHYCSTEEIQKGKCSFKSSTELAGDSWLNQIRIVATDSVGLNDTKQYGVIFSTCGGGGTYWTVEWGDPYPLYLNPSILLMGEESISMGLNLTWVGGSGPEGEISGLKLKVPPLSVNDKEKYDDDWVAAISAPVGKTRSYVTIQLRELDSLFRGKNMTRLEKERNISEHNKGKCIEPEVGCFKVPVMLEINFKAEDYDGNTTRHTQKVCTYVEVSIDTRLPSDKIPQGFLESSIDLIENVIEFIDTILEPLKQIKRYVFYTCLASNVPLLVASMDEAWECEFTADMGKLVGMGFDKRIAMQDMCSIYDKEEKNGGIYKEGGDEEQCNQCKEAIERRMEIEKYRNFFCDRIFCPKVPTIKKYLEDSYKARLSEKTPDEKKYASNMINSGGKSAILFDDQLPENSIKDITTVEQLFSHTSHCSTLEYDKKTGAVEGFSAKEMYDQYQQYKDKCEKLQPFTPECCAWEYMRQWDSGCGVPQNIFGTGFGMNEVKEYYCYVSKESTTNGEYDSRCSTAGRVWNSVAGLCSPTEAAKVEYIGTGKYVDEGKTSQICDTSSTKKTSIKEENPILIRITPLNDEKSVAEIGIGCDATAPLEAEKETLKPGQDSTIQRKHIFRVYSNGAQIQPPTDDEKKEAWSNKFMTEFKKITNQNIDKKVAERVYNKLQTRDPGVLVDPAEGLFRSFECLCIPAMEGYLSWYRSMLTAVKGCLNEILVTGDGSAGMCKAVLSVYVCDLIYEAFKCFINRVGSAPGSRGGIGGTFGNVMGAVKSGGEAVYKSSFDRYGTTTTFKNLVNEQKIVHAFCLWAFTGDWTLDIESFIESNFSIPIRSQGVVYPCTRTFKGVAGESGQNAKFMYHVSGGLVAGADLTWELYLKCSDTANCDEGLDQYGNEVFPNGRCDCLSNSKGEKLAKIDGGRLKAGDIWQGGSNGTRTEAGYYISKTEEYRYDQAVLKWTWKDGDGNTKTDETVCNINTIGGQPPVECKWTIDSYKCNYQFGEMGEYKIVSVSGPEESETLTTGKELGLGVKVYKMSPASVQAMSVSNEPSVNMEELIPAWLHMSIKNSNGAEVYKSSNYYELLEDGTQTLTPEEMFSDFNNKIERSWFSKNPTSQKVSYYAVKGTEEIRPTYNQVGKTIAVKIKDETCNYWEGDGYVNKKEGENSVTVPDAGGKKCDIKDEGSSKTITVGTTKFTIASSKILSGTEYGFAYVVSAPETTTAECTGDKKKFTVTFNMYGSKKINDNSDLKRGNAQINLEDSDSKTLTFEAICDESKATTVGGNCKYGTLLSSECICKNAASPRCGTKEFGEYCVKISDTEDKCMKTGFERCSVSSSSAISSSCYCGNDKEYASVMAGYSTATDKENYLSSNLKSSGYCCYKVTGTEAKIQYVTDKTNCFPELIVTEFKGKDAPADASTTADVDDSKKCFGLACWNNDGTCKDKDGCYKADGTTVDANVAYSSSITPSTGTGISTSISAIPSASDETKVLINLNNKCATGNDKDSCIEMIKKVAKKLEVGVKPEEAVALAWTESTMRPSVSSSSSIGLFQLHSDYDSTWKETYNSKKSIFQLNADWDKNVPLYNAIVGITYFATMIRKVKDNNYFVSETYQYESTLMFAYALYNAGPSGAVKMSTCNNYLTIYNYECPDNKDYAETRYGQARLLARIKSNNANEDVGENILKIMEGVFKARYPRYSDCVQKTEKVELKSDSSKYDIKMTFNEKNTCIKLILS